MARTKNSTRLDDTLEVPDDLQQYVGPKEQQRIDHVKRNIRIKERYEALREEHGWERACEILADRFPSVSKWTVREILAGRR